MKPEDIHKARDPELPASVAAMHRAAALARQIVIQTNTAIIVMEDGKIKRIPAETLRQEQDAETLPASGPRF